MKFSKSLIYILIAILSVISIFYDKKIALFFYNNEIILIKNIMKFISFIGEFYIVFIIFSFYYFIKKNKKNILKTAVIIFFNIILIYFLKILFSRPRPFSASLDSFPSGHASIVFSLVPIIKEKKFKIGWIIFSFLVSFSRLYLVKHYLSDVIVGSVIGYMLGCYLSRKIDKKIKKLK